LKKKEYPTQKLFEYITQLEKTNDQLLLTLKKCVKLLRESTPNVSDPDGWREMIRGFDKVIAMGGKTVGKKESL